MWRLTTVTIILAIPTMIYSFYGMNTLDLPFSEYTLFPTLLSVVATVITAIVLFKFGRFNKR
jgi:magnesium transporter